VFPRCFPQPRYWEAGAPETSIIRGFLRFGGIEIRHPMYGGALLYFVGTSLLLGSWWGLAAVLVLAVLLALRTAIEEHALRSGLQGYDDYAARVRYRLLPLIW
jgi:protein-S-isoprenylcysteine O-methyltransferase Ste14